MSGFVLGVVKNMFPNFKVSAGAGILKVKAQVIFSGQDLVIVFAGGEQDHIGACALALPRKSLANKERLAASASVLCVCGHKEDQLARKAALRLAAKYNCVVSVIVGLHIDNASQKEIEELVAGFETCLALIEERLLQLL